MIYNLVILERREGNRSSNEMLKHKEVATQSERRHSLVLVFDIDRVCVGAYVKAAAFPWAAFRCGISKHLLRRCTAWLQNHLSTCSD